MPCGAHFPLLTRAFAPGGPKAYPEPWVTPEYGPSGKMTNCDAVGKGPLGWATGYATFAVGRASQRLYDNADGIGDAFGRMWAHIARRMKPHCALDAAA